MLNSLLMLADAYSSSQFCDDAGPIFGLIGWVIIILQIAIPIIIIVLGMLDLGKAVMSGDEKEIKEYQKTLIKRIIYGVLVFFLITIVKTIFKLAAPDAINDSSKCWNCVLRPSDCAQKSDSNPQG